MRSDDCLPECRCPPGGQRGGLPVDVTVVDDQFQPGLTKQVLGWLVKRGKTNLMTGVVFPNTMLAVWPEARGRTTLCPYCLPSTPDQTDGMGEPSIFAVDTLLREVHMDRLSHPNAWSLAVVTSSAEW